MAALPSQHPNLSLHLTDRNLHPILTSAHSDTQLEALTSLASTSITAHAAAHRLALGYPQRLIVEHGPGSPVLVTSYLNPAAAVPQPPPPHKSKPRTLQSNHSIPAPSTAAHSTGPNLPPIQDFAATTISDGKDPSLTHMNGTGSGSRTPQSRSRPHTRDSSAITAGSGATALAASEVTQKSPPAKKRVTAPMLVSLVVAGTAEEALDARRAAARLERVGGEVQREWAAEDENRNESDESS